MMRSLFSGVSGLKSHNTRMDVIGNNIANVNTTGFKAGRVTFEDMLSQTLSGASSPGTTIGGTNPKQVGLGVTVGGIDTIFSDGSVQGTGKNTDLALTGNAMFMVKRGDQTYYTRNGAFEFDAKGNYVLPSSGLHVQGWMNKTTEHSKVSTDGAVENIVIEAGKMMAPKATETATYSENLDSNTPMITGYTFSDTSTTPPTARVRTSANSGMYITASKAQPVTLSLSDGTKQTVTSGTYTIGRSLPKVTSFSYYDTLGRKHESIVFLEKAIVTTVKYTDEEGNLVTKRASTWIARVGNPEVNNIDGSKTKHELSATTIAFDEDGVLRAGVLGRTQPVSADPNSNVTTPVAPPATSVNSSEVATLSAEHTEPNGAKKDNEISLRFADDKSPLTQYAGYDTIKAASDGYTGGALASVSFDSAGVITGTYTNGVRRAEAQIGVAKFANPSGLTKLGGNLYQESNNSNSKVVRAQTVESAGAKITPSSLEMSNVDLADQFSDMIITQRGFQSNSKVITVGDEMLETLINMKR